MAEAEAPARGLTVAFTTIEKLGGMPYAIAAVAEGFCPTCTARLTSADGVEVMDDPYPSAPSARGNCNPCALVWTTGTGDWEHAGGDWLTMDDHFDGMLRRMALNPGPDPDDELDDDWEEDWSDDDD